mmetsp:Transcript_45252/g.74986  ORF Transcript_45252/g.74986 Transcript_45252/m.74986 type:complete len:691 (-) Transcript_45252:135-2207(-)|eukprot:CAMPEP_0119301082 /NCGR_PEP_ID=MMETSP1333-20130426/2919_1 /TAXON_ID=418940 /ORGANISM="Scyphosphaera apsteinii, Strain RCC1455" /LENGTH=690 /DNA_ID=CAMNT_0007303057 /DNA_START=126 /DNA_END=2198 /DNA_ORIENTATION=+
MSEIQFIVDRLNEPPFNMQLSLVSFDEKSPFELLEIVNSIMANLSDDHKIDLRDETPEGTANRMMDFFRILNYKQVMEPQMFKQGLLHGDPGIIYPILTWMLHKLPELQKRAYLAKFLVNVEVPEHMFTDEEVVEVYQNYKDLQEEFKEVHKMSEKFKSQLISPAEIKKAIVQMEEDKNMLEHKVENLHTKLQSTERFDDMLVASGKLRVEQDEQLKLQDRLKEQRSHLLQAEHRLNQLKATLSEKRATEAGESDIMRLLQKLDEEVKVLSRKVHGELPNEIARKQQRMEELQQVLSQPLPNENDMREMAQHRQGLMRAVGALEDRKRAMLNNPDDKLAMFRQQANLVSKKREQVMVRLETTAREKADVDAELASKSKEVDALKGKPVLKGEDFRRYATELRGKTAQYKRMKSELAELRAEWGLLSRTEALLREQESGISSKLGEAEARRGVSGFQQTQEQLEKVSQQKAEVDSVKGKTLEEISQVVEEINTQIKENKNRLAPQIKALRSLRTKFQEVESEYLEKKAVFDNTKAGLDSEISKMQAELDSAQKEKAHEESNCHYYESLASIERVKVNRVEDEKQGRSIKRHMPDGSVVRSYKDLYEAKIKDQDRLTKELKERQKHIKENHEPNRIQMGLFKDLHKLMRCKVDMQQRARAEANSMAAASGQDTNVLTMEDDASQPAQDSATY